MSNELTNILPPAKRVAQRFQRTLEPEAHLAAEHKEDMKEPPPKVQDHAETVASCLIEAVLVGTRMKKIRPERLRTHDFDLLDPNGHIIAAVEVTVSLDKTVKETIIPIRNGGPVKTKLCKKDWWIQAEPGADIREIRRNADKYLADVEAAGIERFLGPVDWRKPTVERIFRDLRVYSGSAVVHWKDPGHIWIDLPGAGGRVAASNVVEAVMREAPNNLKKLAAANTDQRHLVVYLDPANYLPWKSLVDSDPPSESPHLPTEITDIWVITETRSAHEYIAWRTSALSPWQRIGPLLLPLAAGINVPICPVIPAGLR